MLCVLTTPCFDSCSCLSPGEPSLRKRSPEGAPQDQPPAKTVVRTGSERSVEAVGVSSSAQVVSIGAVAAETSPPISEGELCRVFPFVEAGMESAMSLCCRVCPMWSDVFSVE